MAKLYGLGTLTARNIADIPSIKATISRAPLPIRSLIFRFLAYQSVYRAHRLSRPSPLTLSLPWLLLYNAANLDGTQGLKGSAVTDCEKSYCYAQHAVQEDHGP